MKRSLRPVRIGQGVGMALALGLLWLSGCASSGNDSGGEEAPEVADSPNRLAFNPNVRIGEVIWTNEEGDFVVVQMDSARADFQPAFFLTLDSAGTQISGVLVGGGGNQGRSFGARLLEGIAPVGSEVRIPGEEWTQYLYNRYNQSERLPVSSGAGP